ncbi:MAG: hypothetical protein COV62_01340 [Candidatus Nealsonbacteria bacterium CG11_big_fil_rev_8_21_14_0_20_35_11]|uniref:DNA 3'-5' helicase n=1 Tax=Candidatus Nealsonbacteria bacterium CG11_big_fil_rev_8_21_14_0_20_35_11 TaxID=1974713 RepID=A0A2H0N2Z0_9BACT|nr:MAG: hypothetical protein COV62_01340 [Candidatus Nealsonbacteria bacterium CG11_big_fil_rev_8_21_14_0_20_35_11]
MKSKKLLLSLNKEQKRIVEFGDGPLLIVAGAGTGKTTVLTQRLVYLISRKQVKPQEILALTFTDKAAQEMEERVDKLLPFGYYDLWISTFHSFCERILKDYGLDIGIPTNFKLLDETGSWVLIKKNFDEFNFLNYYRPLGNPTKFIHALVNHFARLKDEGIYPENYLEYSDSLKLNLDDIPLGSKLIKGKDKSGLAKEQENYQRAKEVAQAYHTYQRLLLKNNALDFGDLINYCLKLFKKRQNILEKFQKQFKYILVDEFQDTNWVQYELVKFLAPPLNNLTVCADDDQSIFSFQGASFNNVLQFKKDYPRAKEIVLVQNYRSSQNILNLAYNLIQLNNPNRLEFQLNSIENLSKKAKQKGVDLTTFKKIDKRLKSSTKEEGLIKVLSFESGEEEVAGVINKIWQLKESDKKADFSDFVILARTNETANNFARGLERAGLPYQFLASRGLYSRPIILDIVSYFKILIDCYDSASFYRVLGMVPLQISQSDIAKIAKYSSQKSLSFFEVLEQLPVLKGISRETINKLSYLLSLIKKHTEASRQKNTSEIFVNILEDLGYLKYLAQEKEESLRDLEMISQFYQKLKDFESFQVDGKLPSFLTELQMEIESGEEGALKFNLEEGGPESIKVMTIHSAKGLEFKYVFLVNLVDKRFPTIERREPIEIPEPLIKEVLPEGDFHLQEERRLFYVGLTRTKRGLFLTWAKDYGGRTIRKPSRFLIEADLIKERQDFAKEKVPQKLNFSFQKQPLDKLKTNTKVLLPNHFSFTQLAAFSKCPLQYKFAHILKIPIRGKAVFSFGKTMHNTLFRFVNLAACQLQLNQTNLFGKSSQQRTKMEDLKLDDLFRIYKEEWIDDWYGDSSQKKEYYQKGKKTLRTFFENFIRTKPQTLFINGSPALEKDFHLKIGQDSFIGKIDRIDKISEDKVEILDYKTGNPNTKERLNSEDKLQLLIYQLAAKKVFNLSPFELTYHYLENNSRLSFSPKEGEIERTEKEILNRIKEIKNSDFSPVPGWQCKFCDFKDICPYRKISG